MAERSPTPDEDEFWLQRAGSIVLESPEKLEAGAQRIAAAMAWFWTVYAATAIVVGSRSDQPTDVAIVALRVAPVVLLFAAYIVATWAALPIEIEFNDQRPDQIKAAHDEAVSKRRSRLTAAVVLAVTAAIVVSAVVITGAIVADQGDDSIQFGTSEPNHVLVSGQLDEVFEVVVEIRRVGFDGVVKVVPLSNGEFSVSLSVPTAGEYETTVRYERDDQSFAVAERVMVEDG